MPELIKITNKKTLIHFLAECRDIHQIYADNPKWCRGLVGSVKHHKEYVQKYQDAIDFIRKKLRIN